MKSKILLGGVMIVSIAAIGYIVFGGSTIEVVAEPKVVELTPLEELTKEIRDSVEFQNEVRLLAEARAMYQLSISKQDEAVVLAEQALATYQEAKSFENDWKINQTEITN